MTRQMKCKTSYMLGTLERVAVYVLAPDALSRDYVSVPLPRPLVYRSVLCSSKNLLRQLGEHGWRLHPRASSIST